MDTRALVSCVKGKLLCRDGKNGIQLWLWLAGDVTVNGSEE